VLRFASDFTQGRTLVNAVMEGRLLQRLQMVLDDEAADLLA
jgi:hypothetical protein